MRGVISFGVDENGKFYFESASARYDTEITPSEKEADALGYIVAAVGDLADELRFYRRSDSYLTVCVCSPNCDFLRLKATERALWFSLDMWGSPFTKSALFDSVQNKKQRHWKVNLSSVEDIAAYSEAIREAAERNAKNAKM